jgi:hypothetical protein
VTTAYERGTLNLGVVLLPVPVILKSRFASGGRLCCPVGPVETPSRWGATVVVPPCCGVVVGVALVANVDVVAPRPTRRFLTAEDEVVACGASRVVEVVLPRESDAVVDEVLRLAPLREDLPPQPATATTAIATSNIPEPRMLAYCPIGSR